MGEYKKALDAFIGSANGGPHWDRHIPDELCAKIVTAEDYVDFLEFIASNLHSDYLEYGTEDTKDLLEKLHANYRDDELLQYAHGKGIQSEFGILAYLTILALGNS